jgi:hypothetical protein
MEVGIALATIKEKKLYLEGYGTFKEYCNGRWGWTPQHTNRIIECSEFVKRLESEPTGSVMPTSERQIRPLTSLDKEAQHEAWIEANKIAEKDDVPVTGKLVEKVVAKMRETEPVSTKDCQGAVAESCADKAISWVDEINMDHHGAREAVIKVIDYCNKLLGENK